MQETISIKNSNAQRALANYNLAIARGWSLSEAITFATDELESPAEIDQLQILLNNQFINEMAAEMHSFLENITNDFF